MAQAAARELAKSIAGNVPYFDGTESGPSRLKEFLSKLKSVWKVSGLQLTEEAGALMAATRLTGAASAWWEMLEEEA